MDDMGKKKDNGSSQSDHTSGQGQIITPKLMFKSGIVSVSTETIMKNSKTILTDALRGKFKRPSEQ